MFSLKLLESASNLGFSLRVPEIKQKEKSSLFADHKMTTHTHSTKFEKIFLTVPGRKQVLLVISCSLN
jgi:hypothetical protein